MAVNGSVGPFIQGSEDWLTYIERLDQYFIANTIVEAGKQWAILLSMCGATTYQLIRDLTFPDRLSEKNVFKLWNQ